MENIKNRSLRVKLIGLVLLVMALIGGGSLYSLNNIANSYKSEISNSYSYYAKSLSEKIAAQFYERYGDVQVFAVDQVTQELNKDLLPSQLDIFVEKYGIYQLILVVNRNGDFVAANTKDTSGKSINTKELSKLNFKNSPWFKSTLNNQFTEDKSLGFTETLFEEPHFDPLLKTIYGHDQVSMGFTTPIKAKNGEIIGVITNRSSTKWLDTEMQMMYDTIVDSGDKSVNFSIINKDGVVLSEIVPEENSGRKIPSYNEQRFLKLNMKDILNSAVTMAISGKSGVMEIFDKTDDAENIVGYNHIESPKWPHSIGWSVLIHNSLEEVMADETKAKRNFLIMLVCVVLLALGLSILVSIAISKEISRISVVLEKSSVDVSDAAFKISSSSTELASSAQKQSAALQETVAAVDEISAMVDKNAESANRSKESSEESRIAATKGREIVENMINSIQQINQANTEVSNQVNTNNTRLSEITKLIHDIGAKTKVINDIVFQTKLLSFNASVEAARAGEYGKGFSVVAEEVGKLAEMSGTSAKEISSLLDESVHKVQQIADESKTRIESLIKESNEKIKLGSDTASQCDRALEEILKSVSTVDTLVSEIAVASSEQATGIREIAKAVAQMEEVTQENAAASQASSVSAEQLSSQSTELKSVVEKLVHIVEGHGLNKNNVNLTQETNDDVPKDSNVVTLRKKTARQMPIKKVALESPSPSNADPGFDEDSA